MLNENDVKKAIDNVTKRIAKKAGVKAENVKLEANGYSFDKENHDDLAPFIETTIPVVKVAKRSQDPNDATKLVHDKDDSGALLYRYKLIANKVPFTVHPDLVEEVNGKFVLKTKDVVVLTNISVSGSGATASARGNFAISVVGSQGATAGELNVVG